MDRQPGVHVSGDAAPRSAVDVRDRVERRNRVEGARRRRLLLRRVSARHGRGGRGGGSAGGNSGRILAGPTGSIGPNGGPPGGGLPDWFGPTGAPGGPGGRGSGACPQAPEPRLRTE